MFFRIILCLILLIIGHVLFAQERPEENAIIQPTESKVSHYVGLQANQLLKQLLNFGGNTSAITNPYVLVYSVNSKKSGFGVSTGLGLSTIQTRSTDNFQNTISKTNDFAWRVGLEDKKYLSRHWLASFGWDVLVEVDHSEVTSSSGGVANPKVTSNEIRTGTGPRVTLNYQFHDRLMIGTEGSMYFKWIKNTQSTSAVGSSNTDINSHLKSFSINAPVVIFVMMKF